MKKSIDITIVIIYVLLLVAHVPEIVYSEEQRKLKFVVDDYPPYQIDPSYKQDMKGYMIDLVNEVYPDTPIEIEFLPWVRVIRSMEKGEADGAFSILYTEESRSMELNKKKKDVG
jgi:hypothetical protein